MSHSQHRLSVALLASTLLLSISVELSSQQQVPARREFRESLDVSLVNLDVFVYDKKGNPVTGLTQEDFEILEDYRPVDVSNFTAVDGLPEATAGGKVEDVALVEPLTVAFYLDSPLMSPNDRSRVLSDVGTFLGTGFPAGTEFLLAASGMKQLEVVVSQTLDPLELRDSLGEVTSDTSSTLAVTERARVVSRVDTLYQSCEGMQFCEPCVDFWDQMVSTVRQFAIEESNRVSRSSQSLARFVSALGGVPGRKALVYISGGLPLQPGFEMFTYLTNYCPERELEISGLQWEYNETSTLNFLAAHANANRVTFYTLDAGGTRTSTDIGSNQRLSDFAAASGNVARDFVSNMQGSLFLLGKETGGEAILNADRPLSSLQRVFENSLSYYSIAYRAPERREAPSHLIEVNLVGKAAKGRTVKYRRTLRAKSEDERLVERLMATLLLDAEDNPLEVAVSFEDQSLVDKKTRRLPVRVVVPPDTLTPLVKAGIPHGRLRLFMTARDDANRGATVAEKMIELGPEELAGNELLSYVINMDLEPGDYRVAVGVRDEISKIASYLREEVTIAD